jgi:RNA polymerase sigma factor (sigma-70 family)
MTELNGHELLAEFARSGSEVAFATLTARHVNLVYSAALRFCGNAHHCEEITQAVFIILARKAGKLSSRVVLSGWLYQTARLTAANFVKREIRRQQREQEACMQSTLTETETAVWQQLAPLLDEAMGRLGETDRNVVVLRFFENKTAAEVAAALKTTEAAANKRVNRALEKLRKIFSKRGVTLSAALIAGTVAANSVQAAPVGLAAAVTATVAKGTLISATITTLVKGTMKVMTWMKIKFVAGVGIAALIAGGASTVAVSQTGNGDRLGAPEIIKRSQDAYAALTSYSDEGKTVSSVGKSEVAPHTFSIKLARPNLYRIEWTQDLGFYAQTGLVWSAGNGDFLKMNQASQPRKDASMEMALSSATGISGGAAGSIPGTFFKLNWGDKLGTAMRSAKRKPDEKIDGGDCYVLTLAANGRTQTLWIGKQDYFIRQFENDTSAAVLKAVVEEQAKKHPEMHLPTTVGGDVKSVETHSKIVVNQILTKADFNP